MSGDGPNLAAQQQAMNHGKGGGGHPIDLNSAFGRNAEGATAIMHGHDVTLAHSMEEIISALKNHASSGGGSSDGDSGAGVGRGGGADALQPIGAGAPFSPSYTEFVTAGARSKSDSGGGGMGIG